MRISERCSDFKDMVVIPVVVLVSLTAPLRESVRTNLLLVPLVQELGEATRALHDHGGVLLVRYSLPIRIGWFHVDQ